MIYALDIGTRTVIGVLAEKYESTITIYDTLIKEHEERAMLDGAIHDVNKVAKIVQQITKTLKEKNDITIDKASVALAGRFLKTSIGESWMDVSNEHAIAKDTIRILEMEAINKSIDSLETDGKEMYCVGYSVLYYSLDDEWIKNLEGQRGKKISVKV
ncbi:MAG: cell division protein FtsA, partial [Thermotogota bacterium]|nr:cell division protein FtsA [Thermotogota bacterium]